MLLRAAGYLASWLVLTVALGLLLFTTSHRTVDVASHEADLKPDLTGEVVVRTGPVLPDVRIASGAPIGVEILLGKTDVADVEALTQRYATIASNPDGQVAKVRGALEEMAVDAAVRGAALAVLPLMAWAAVGRSRRRRLYRHMLSRGGIATSLALVLVGVGLAQPWHWGSGPTRPPEEWQSLQEFLGPDVSLPAEAADVEVLAEGVTRSTRRIVSSLVSSYRRGEAFYAQAAEDAQGLELRVPEEGETVVLLVTDRHDNVGMDAVARAIGESGGATAVYDLGDDTSSGEAWEAFSLDSVSAAFDDWGRWAVAGNHDNGSFVREYMEELGWTYLDGEVIDGPGGSRLLGVDDPRSSGFGDWRDETGLSFSEVEERLADAACAADEEGDRISTIIVHDANLASAALDRGCADLVVAGHTHVEDGPTEVVGENGSTGYTFTSGTTGGAAYAVALGSKLRRAAGVALVTYRDGRPVGVQGVTLQTNGRYDVGEWAALEPGAAADVEDGRRGGDAGGGAGAGAGGGKKDPGGAAGGE
ncbi:metallophosphoesterase [Nocardioides sp. YIM 152588]|uniref:metallophosphoesterase n=1 Tax=Nocardioides sp. YIM 152588 TaxID=3158259 RepID=UPI0032E4ACA5